MRILVTGSKGTLGRPLLRELRRRGHDVFGCDLSHSCDRNEWRADVASYRQLEEVFEASSPELVYHLAAEFGRNNGQEFFEQLWRTNQIGTRNVIDLCVESGARMILAGSSEAYGDQIQDSVGEVVDNESALREYFLDHHIGIFHNEYALSKWTQERQVFIAAKNEGLKAVVLRFFNAYGPGEYYTPYRSVVCLFCYRLMFGLPIQVYKNYHRVFMYVDDMMRTLANAAERFDLLKPELPATGIVPVYNVGGSEYRSVEELSEIVLKEVSSVFHGAYVPARATISTLEKEAANVTNKRPDIDLAKRDLGHELTVALEEGVALTLAWMREVYDAEGGLREASNEPASQVKA